VLLKSHFNNSIRAISTTAQNSSKDSRNNIMMKIANINSTNYRDGKYFNLTKDFLCDVNFLRYSYNVLNNASSNQTSTCDGQSFGHVERTVFYKYVELLKNAEIVFKPAKKIYIPRTSNHSRIRVLTVITPRDKIIQKAISILLNLIYENTNDGFLECSHSFRSNKSTHTALEYIKKN
jgi:hypothetical protein